MNDREPTFYESLEEMRRQFHLLGIALVTPIRAWLTADRLFFLLRLWLVLFTLAMWMTWGK